jgi:predicted hydrocarbon binding protein
MRESNDPQGLGRVLHRAMEEVLGAEGLRALLECAGLEAGSEAAGAEFMEGGRFASSRFERVLAALEQLHGALAARGLAQRIGRACFGYGLREYGDMLGVTTTSFRLLPFPKKVKTFASALAGLFNGFSNSTVRVEEEDGKVRWLMESCPFCRGQHAENGICTLPAGVAEEALYWLSGGKMFQVEEVACMAHGDAACILQVEDRPLDS